MLQKITALQWNKQRQEAFDLLKITLCKASVLQFSDLNLSFLLTVDACAYSIEGYTAQIVDKTERPIAYFSKVLKGAEKRYSTYEKEALAIKYGILVTLKVSIYIEKNSIFSWTTNHWYRLQKLTKIPEYRSGVWN